MVGRRLLPTILFLAVASCSPPVRVSTPNPVPTEYACTESGTVQAAAVDSKTEVCIYLPPCYADQPDRFYPVLYLFPGFSGTNNDFIGDTGANRIADEMILPGEIPPFIIVATDDMFPDLDAAAVTEKILPYMDANFRTLPERRFRAAAGGSFGGAVAYHLAFKRYDLFGTAGIFGNGAARGEEEAIRRWLAIIPLEKRPRVFINVGEGDTYMLQRAKVLIPLLDEAGIPHKEIFNPGAHSGDYWLGNFPAYFRWLGKDWQ